MKHISVSDLWMQEVIEQGKLRCDKIARNEYISDMRTHHWSKKDGDVHMKNAGFMTLGPEIGMVPDHKEKTSKCISRKA